MKARFSPPNELELAGSSSELAELKLQLEDESKSDFEVNLEAHDPEPYDQALRVLTVQISDGPTRIEVSRDQVSVSGSRANIGRFASFLVVRPDQHNHYEHYPGNEWVDEGSTPIVIACESK